MKRLLLTYVEKHKVTKWLIILLMISSFFSYGQQRITFQPYVGDAKLQLDNYYPLNNSDSIRFDRLKFYISNIQFLKDNKEVFTLKKKHFLIDLEKIPSQTISFAMDENVLYNKVRFEIGIDSITNTSGAFGDDLDPTNGMYWTWRSGYINFKLEGTSNLCPTRKNRFTFHIGGYQYPNNTLRTVTLFLKPEDEITIRLQLDDFFKSIDLSQTHKIMSPGEKAVELATLISTLFKME